MTGQAIENDNADSGVSNYEICDRTGFKVKPGELVREWTGRMVRRQSWEPRHPQDLIRTTPETQKGSPRPEQPDQFIGDLYPDGVDPTTL